ncbi:unnamed protein product [Gongylonema pulchrum]|uniref:Ribosomal protein L34 n=1 Tax=Gongylonema pulchrum TaxID=637853 RepID=A0A183D4E6_9BILA|nr:unnamed protein product [Gongylonema pulchrum]
MSGLDTREESVPHRGFTVKAREVLLEPPAPFALTKDISGSCSNISDSPKAPHRGFTAKAREMLVERQTHDNHHGLKCKFKNNHSLYGKRRLGRVRKIRNGEKGKRG